MFNYFFLKIDWLEVNLIYKSNVYILYRLSIDYKIFLDNYWSRLSLLEECVLGDKFSDYKINIYRECGGCYMWYKYVGVFGGGKG